MGCDRHTEHDDIASWVRRHQARAWRFVRLRGCPADLADDLLQDALMAAVAKDVYTQPDERAAAWLCGALDNLWLMHLRTEGRRARRVDAVVAERALRQAAPHDDGSLWLGALRACLALLDGRSRRLLDMHYADGASRESIAAELGLRVNGVKALLRRVRGALRECVLRRLRSEQEHGE
ncbi:MAG TPA: sigma-70 family RNA polymerase sigma factor [Planctomycetota bacterium]|nr:sigma-70 family RNA polymerase sigma factor [Planctomycetota bacterium]